MIQGINRAFTLFVIFALAFLSVFFIKNTEMGEGLVKKLRFKKSPNGYSNETYQLQDKPSIDLSQVELLEAINRESATLVKSVVPSVVSIDTAGVQHQKLRDVFGRTWVQRRPVQGQGSGVIVTREGHILTNYHVVQGEPSISVTMHDGSIREARVIGSDPTVDISVLKIMDSGPFVPLKFGDSSKLEVGNTVYAVGSPFGLGESVTNGIISAKKRSFTDSQVDLLQTSAAINPGNSGGPLVNILGEIIGINSRIYSTNKDNPSFQGIGFAIPSNDAFKTMTDILERGRALRGFLGMSLDNVDAHARRSLKFGNREGVRVDRIVPNSPAMHSGLLENDIITSFNGEGATSSHRLISLIRQSELGSEVKVGVWRDGESIVLTSTIGEAGDYSSFELSEEKVVLDTKAVLTAIGLYVRDLSDAEKARGLRGVIVSKVDEASTLQGKLQVGDLIRAINGNYTMASEGFLLQLAESAIVQDTQLFIIREKAVLRVTISKVE